MDQGWKVGDVVVTIRALSNCPFGHLELDAGRHVNIQHVGSVGDELGWLFGVADGRSGWLPVDACLPVKTPHENAKVSDTDCFSVFHDCPAREDLGYLALRIGDEVFLEFQGSGADEQWAFGSTRCGKRGWFPSRALQAPVAHLPPPPRRPPPTEECEVRVHCRTGAHEGGSSAFRPRPDHAAHASTEECLVIPGEHVQVGDVVVTSRAVSNCPSGHLELDAGRHVDIQYVGSVGDELGWLFGVADGRSGWLPVDACLPVKTPHENAKVSDTDCFSVFHDCPAREDLGYLALRIGDEVFLEFQGSGADEQWAFGSTRCGKRGWFPSRALQAPVAHLPPPPRRPPPTEECEVRVHCRTGAHKGGSSALRLRPDRAAHASTEGLVMPGEHVQVLSDDGEWAYIALHRRNFETGWLQSKHLRPLAAAPVCGVRCQNVSNLAR